MAKKNRTFSFGPEHWARLTDLSKSMFGRVDQRTRVLERLIDDASSEIILPADTVPPSPQPGTQGAPKDPPSDLPLTRPDPVKIQEAQRRLLGKKK